MDKEKDFAEVVAEPTDIRALAEALGVSYEVVCNWRSRGVPANRAKEVAAQTGVSLKRLRPLDWRAYWPELADSTNEPAKA